MIGVVDMLEHTAIAILHNMSDPVEREKFSDVQIMDAIFMVMFEMTDTKKVTKQAYCNAAKYLYGKYIGTFKFELKVKENENGDY